MNVCVYLRVYAMHDKVKCIASYDVRNVIIPQEGKLMPISRSHACIMNLNDDNNCAGLNSIADESS
jgi:hypothetical protein